MSAWIWSSRGSDLRLIALDLGGIDVVLLLVRADLELLQHEILGDLGTPDALRLDTWIGRDGSRSHDHASRWSPSRTTGPLSPPRPWRAIALGIGDLASSSGTSLRRSRLTGHLIDLWSTVQPDAGVELHR